MREKEKRFITMKDLKKKKFKTNDVLISNILTRGINLFSGKRKIGKTFLLIQIAHALSNSEDFLKEKTVKSNVVLYYSLETSEKEFQKRLLNLKENSKNLFLNFNSSLSIFDLSLDIEQIKKNYAKKNIIIIIDPLVKLNFGRKYNMNDYQDVYDIIASLMRIRDTYNVTFILVMHNKKNREDDKIDNILGSTGIVGAVENILVLEKKPNKNEYELIVESRYMESNVMQLEKNRNGFFDRVLSDDEELLYTDNSDIIRIINYVTNITEKNKNEKTFRKEEFSDEECGIECQANVMCSRMNLKFTTPNRIKKLILDNMDLLIQNNIHYSARRSNGCNLIKLWYEEKIEDSTDDMERS